MFRIFKITDFDYLVDKMSNFRNAVILVSAYAMIST